MINLIPPSAKKGITLEYWKRVTVVWLWLFSVALMMVTVFLLPTYLRLQSEIGFLESSVSAGTQRVANYDISATELITTSNRAKLLLSSVATTSPSDFVSILNDYAGTAVQLHNFQFNKFDSTPVITVSGVALSRQTLAAFRDLVGTDAKFTSVNLPISNLIKDKNLLFTMDITLATSTPL